VILGHLVPAGTGFRNYQDSEVRIRPQALEGLAPVKEDVLAREFPLLQGASPAAAPAPQGDGQQAAPAAAPAGVSPLDQLIGEPSEESDEE
jgi:DNA-directed RNA polymerase subunit beta'